jgi:signal transduction histidine kinase
VPAGRTARHAYHWGAAALAGLGVVQILAVPPVANAALAVLAAIGAGVGIWFLPTRTLWASWALAAAVATMVVAIGTPVFATFLGAMVAMFSLGRFGAGRHAWSGYLAIGAATAAVAIPEIASGQDGVFGLVYPLVYFGGAGVLGWLARQRALYVRSIADRAAVLERDQAQQAALAAAAERARIARDLHDVIAHGVSLMVVQAEAAREVLTRHPDQAGAALDAIGVAGRQAIADLRQMLGVLRDPTPSLAIADLVDPVRAAGLAVDLIQTGDESAVSTHVRSAVFRLVQEALTNTLRHSGAGHVRVTVHYGTTEVEIEVLDDGNAPPEPGGVGHGLAGMRERARQVNGDVVVGPRPDGPGFGVWASLPTAGIRAAESVGA